MVLSFHPGDPFPVYLSETLKIKDFVAGEKVLL